MQWRKTCLHIRIDSKHLLIHMKAVKGIFFEAELFIFKWCRWLGFIEQNGKMFITFPAMNQDLLSAESWVEDYFDRTQIVPLQCLESSRKNEVCQGHLVCTKGCIKIVYPCKILKVTFLFARTSEEIIFFKKPNRLVPHAHLLWRPLCQ